MRATFPQRWEEVPKGVYDPLKVLATGGPRSAKRGIVSFTLKVPRRDAKIT